jgi:hypothetical protein
MRRPVQIFTTTVHAFTSLVNFFLYFYPTEPGDVLDPSLSFLPRGLVEGQVAIFVGSWTSARSVGQGMILRRIYSKGK